MSLSAVVDNTNSNDNSNGKVNNRNINNHKQQQQQKEQQQQWQQQCWQQEQQRPCLICFTKQGRQQQQQQQQQPCSCWCCHLPNQHQHRRSHNHARWHCCEDPWFQFCHIQRYWCQWTRTNQLVCLGSHGGETIKSLLDRLEAKSFNIRYSNLKKQEFINAISKAYINKDLYKTGGGSNAAARKQRQCPYRIINILFSDEFAGDFGLVGNSATRAELGSGDACNNRGFWVRIQAAFKEPNPIYNKMQLQFPVDHKRH